MAGFIVQNARSILGLCTDSFTHKQLRTVLSGVRCRRDIGALLTEGDEENICDKYRSVQACVIHPKVNGASCLDALSLLKRFTS
jgi:hypothetical protein